MKSPHPPTHPLQRYKAQVGPKGAHEKIRRSKCSPLLSIEAAGDCTTVRLLFAFIGIVNYGWAVAVRRFFAETFPGTFGTSTYKAFLISVFLFAVLANEDESFGEAHLRLAHERTGMIPGEGVPLPLHGREPMSWTRPVELFIEAAFIVWLIDLIRKPLPERYRRNAAVAPKNSRRYLWRSLSKARYYLSRTR